jgi:hypothetical protein
VTRQPPVDPWHKHSSLVVSERKEIWISDDCIFPSLFCIENCSVLFKYNESGVFEECQMILCLETTNSPILFLEHHSSKMQVDHFFIVQMTVEE